MIICFITLIVASFTYVHASPSNLYILQLFTLCSCIAASCLHPVAVCDVAIAFLLVLLNHIEQVFFIIRHQTFCTGVHLVLLQLFL